MESSPVYAIIAILKTNFTFFMKKFIFSMVWVFASVTLVSAQGNLGKGGKQLNAGVGFSSFGHSLAKNPKAAADTRTRTNRVLGLSQ